VSGSTPFTAFTLYTSGYTDASGGAPGSTFPYSLIASGGLAFTTAGSWANSFTTSRYLKLTFPGYVPAGATVTGATYKGSYRATTSGRTACYYLEVYSGATLIGTHGSSGSPLSCNSTTSYTTDTVSLPEVNTAARANGVLVKLYFTVTGATPRTTDHDFAQLIVNYQ
jgi:hypothetical protein